MTFVAGPQHLEGHAGRLNLVAWRTWKLKRKAISTNDGEIQCILEGEDHNFRTRFLWSQLNGCCALPPGDHLQRANYMMQYTKGIIATDSKGGYDAVTKSEGPMLGLSNARSALQAYQLREQLAESFCRLIWISGDWNLSSKQSRTMDPRGFRSDRGCIYLHFFFIFFHFFLFFFIFFYGFLFFLILNHFFLFFFF